MHRALALLCLAACACAAVPASAWRDSGHQAVALIAYGRLRPRAKAAVDAILRADPGKRTLLTAAVWPDKVRRHPKWHYVNIPYVPGRPPGRVPAPPNVIEAIQVNGRLVADAKLPPERRADALSNLIHFVADVNQPMHSVARIDRRIPKGDRGGNDFLLRGPYRNLHALWDDAPDQGRVKALPQALASAVCAEAPPGSMRREVRRTSPRTWAFESYDVAVRQAYDLPTGGPVKTLPSKRYLDDARKTARRRIALAGYRLANLLNKTLR